jgi:hypothetical protein
VRCLFTERPKVKGIRLTFPVQRFSLNCEAIMNFSSIHGGHMNKNNLIKDGLLVTACSIAIATGFISSSFAADTTAPVTATATIDWSKLQISVTGVNGVTPTVTFSDQNESLSSYASAPGLYESNSKSVNNWTDTAQTNADAGTTFSNALASLSSFSGTANSAENGSTTSSGSRAESFTFSGPGVLTVTVPYTISLTGDTPPACYYCYYNYDQASISGHASFYSNNNNGSSDSYSNVSYSLNNHYGYTSPQSQSGTLVLGIFANGPGNGSLAVNFDLSANPVSSIPEPESYAMLLAGLGLLGAVARRRRT